MSESYLVYHYCTVDTFKSILKSKVLWLCDLTDSNDEQEVIRTFVVLWEGVKRRLKQTDLPKDVLNDAIQLIDKQYKTEIQTDPPQRNSRVRPQCWELSVNLNELYLYTLKYVL